MSASSVRLPEDAVSSLAMIQKEMSLACSSRNTDFRMVVEDQEFELGEALPTCVDFGLDDAPYNIRRL